MSYKQIDKMFDEKYGEEDNGKYFLPFIISTEARELKSFLHSIYDQAKAEQKHKLRQSVELWMNTHDRTGKSFNTDEFIKYILEE